MFAWGCVLVPRVFVRPKGWRGSHQVLSNHHPILAFSGMCHCLLGHLSIRVIVVSSLLRLLRYEHRGGVLLHSHCPAGGPQYVVLSPVHPQTPLGPCLLCWSMLFKASPRHRPYWQIWLRLSLLLNPSKPIWDFCLPCLQSFCLRRMEGRAEALPLGMQPVASPFTLSLPLVHPSYLM